MNQRRTPTVMSPSPDALWTNLGLPATVAGSARFELALTMIGAATDTFHCVESAYVPLSSM